MALLSPPPKMQFFGDDGLPLSGGLVHTYSKDTTTPLATYIDSTGSVANSNPVALDSQGRANIWLQITPYSFVIYNALGVLQSCSGPIEFPPAAVSGSDIAAWSDIVVYDYPDLVAGTDGFTYRCVGTNILDDDPVGSVTGAWVNLSSIASPNLTGTPTAPTAAAGTNTTQIATTAFVQTALTPVTVTDVLPEGGVWGFDMTTMTGNVLTFSKGSCKNATGNLIIKFEATKNVTITATNNQNWFIFAVRLLDGVTYEARAYTTYAGAAGDAQIDAWRLISFAKNNASGVTMPFRQVAGTIFWSGASYPELALTSSYVEYNINTLLPLTIFKSFGIMALVGSEWIYISLDGTNLYSYFGYFEGSVAEFPAISSIWLKNTGTASARFRFAKLRL